MAKKKYKYTYGQTMKDEFNGVNDEFRQEKEYRDLTTEYDLEQTISPNTTYGRNYAQRAADAQRLHDRAFNLSGSMKAKTKNNKLGKMADYFGTQRDTYKEESEKAARSVALSMFKKPSLRADIILDKYGKPTENKAEEMTTTMSPGRQRYNESTAEQRKLVEEYRQYWEQKSEHERNRFADFDRKGMQEKAQQLYDAGYTPSELVEIMEDYEGVKGSAKAYDYTKSKRDTVDSLNEDEKTLASEYLHAKQQYDLAMERGDMRMAEENYGAVKTASEKLKSIGWDDEKIHKTAQYLQEDQTAKGMQDLAQKSQEYIDEHPVLGGAAYVTANTLMAPAQGFSELRSIADAAASGRPLDTNASPYKAIEQGLSYTGQKVEDRFGALGKFAFDAGTSFLASRATMAVGGWAGEALTLPMFGMSAFASTYRNDVEKGIGEKQALAHGFWSGLAEAISEKLPMDNMIEMYNMGSAGQLSAWKTIKQTLMNMGVEGLEEAFSDFADNLADISINGHMSEYMTNIRNYRQAGYNERQAKLLAENEFWKEVAYDFGVGAVSAGLSTIPAVAQGKRAYKKAAKGLSTSQKESLIELAQSVDAQGITAQSIADDVTADTMTDEQAAKLIESLADFSGAYEGVGVALEEIIEGRGEVQEGEQVDEETGENNLEELPPLEPEEDDLVLEDLPPLEPENPTSNTGNGAFATEESALKKIAEKAAERKLRGIGQEQRFSIPQLTRLSDNNAEINLNGRPVKLSNITYANERQQKTYSAAVSRFGTNMEAANAFIDMVNEYKGNRSVDMLANTAQYVYKAGLAGGADFYTIENSLQNRGLIEVDSDNNALKKVYEAGARQRLAENPTRTVPQHTATSGKVDVQAESNRAGVKMTEILMRKLGTDAIYKAMDNNGSYNPATGQFNFSNTATNDFSAIAHEVFGEFLNENNREGFEEIQSVLMDYAIKSRGIDNVTDILTAYKKGYTDEDHNPTMEDAAKEWVADHAGDILFGDEEGIRSVVEWSLSENGEEKTRSFVQKVVDFIDKLVSAIKKYMSGHASTNAEALTHIKDIGEDDIREIRKMWLDAMDIAIASYRANLIEEYENVAKMGEKFSIDVPIEQTDELIAVHNLTEAKLLKQLDLEAFPMPSIAITKAALGWTNFGEYSYVFRKDTIDPKNKKNKVFAADAWTPTFPRIEYEPNYAKARDIQDKLYDITGDIPTVFSSRVRSFVSGLEYSLDNYGGMEGILERTKDDVSMKAAFLANKGEKVNEYQIEKKQEMAPAEIGIAKALLNRFEGVDLTEVLKQKGKEVFNQYGDEIKDTMVEYFVGQGIDEETAENVVGRMKGLELIGYLRKARDYSTNGGVKTTVETDYVRMDKEVAERVDQEEYEKWIRDLFDGVVKDTGISNGKEIFTPSGTRRSFKQTHLPVNAKNIVKSMIAQADDIRNTDGFNGIKSIRAVAVDEFKSIKAIKAQADKLQNIDSELFEKAQEELSNRLYKVLGEISEAKSMSDNPYIDLEIIGENVLEAAGKTTSPESIKKLLESYGRVVTIEQAEELNNIIAAVREMPVNMFEAKPLRTVDYSEGTLVMPNNASQEVRDKAAKWGINTLEYEAGNDESRKAVVNSIEGARFSKDVNLTEDTSGRELSEEQKEFFKDSKVRTEDGKLMVMYHGSNSRFTVFDRSAGIANGRNFGDGFYFTNKERDAKYWGRGTVYKCYLDIKNPFYVSDKIKAPEGILNILRENLGRKYDQYSQRASWWGNEYSKNEWVEKELERSSNTRDAMTNLVELNDEGLSEKEYARRVAEEKTRILKELGYDGVVVLRKGDGTNGGSEVVAFDQNQIKNVDNTAPTENADIRFSEDIILDEAINYDQQQSDMNTIVSEGMGLIEEANLSEKAVRKVAREIIKETGSSYKAEDLTKELTAVFSYIKTNDVTADDISRIMTEVARPILEKTAKPDAKAEADYKDFMSYIKGKKIKLNDKQIEEIEYAFDSYNSFRKQNLWRVQFSKGGTNLDEIWSEIVDHSYGQLTTDIPDAEMPLALIDFMDNLKPHAELEGNIDDASYDLALDIFGKFFQEQAQEESDQKLKTRMESKKEKLVEQKNEYKKKLDQKYEKKMKELEMLQRAEVSRIAQEIVAYDEQEQVALLQRDFATAALVEAEKIKAEKKRRQMQEKLHKERFEAAMDKERIREGYRERAKERRRKEIARMLEKEWHAIEKMVEAPTTGNHIPNKMLKLTMNMLSIINLDSGNETIKVQKYRKALHKLKKQIDLYNDHNKALAKEMGIPSYENAELIQKMDRLMDIFSEETDYLKLDYDTLSEVLDTVRLVRKEVNSEREAFDNQYSSQIEYLARAATEEIRQGKQTALVTNETIDKYFTWHMDAKREFRKLSGYRENGAVMSLYKEFERGQMKDMMIHREVDRMFAPVTEGKENQKKMEDLRSTKEEDLVSVMIGGVPVKITKAMRLAIMMHSMNKDNLLHMCGGGLVIPDMKLLEKGKRQQAYAEGKRYAFITEDEWKSVMGSLKHAKHELSIVREEIKNTTDENAKDRLKVKEKKFEEDRDFAIQTLQSMQILKKYEIQAWEEDLSDYEKEVFELMKDFFHKYSGKKMNEASLQMFDYRVARVKNYFPIHTDPTFVNKDYAAMKMDSRIENAGSTKTRVVGSTSAIMLYDIVDEMLDQTDFIGKYNGMAMPVRDMNSALTKVLQDYVEDENGKMVPDGDPYTLGSEIERLWKIGNQKYIVDLMKDVSGVRRGGQNIWSKTLNDMRSKYAGAALVGNVGVAMKQAASYPTAAAVLGTKPLAKALKDIAHKNGIAELEEINPLLWYRAEGNIDEQFEAAKKSWLMKKMPGPLKALTVGLIQNVDKQTVQTLEYASMYYVDMNMPDLEKGSKKYWEAVSDTFTRVVTETQPNYSTLERPAILRDPSDVTKMLMMFKTQPLQNAQIVIDAVGELNARGRELKQIKDKKSDAAKEKTSEVKEAKKKLARAISSQISAALVFSAMSILSNLVYHKMWKYKEDDEWSIKKVAEAMGSGMASTFAGSLIFGDYVYQAITEWLFGMPNYGVQISVVEAYNNLTHGINSIKDNSINLAKATTTAEKEDAMLGLRISITNTLTSVAQFTGVPFNSIKNSAESIYLYAKDIAEGKPLGTSEMPYTYTTTRTNTSLPSQAERMKEAYLEGDDEELEKLAKESAEKYKQENPEKEEKTVEDYIKETRSNVKSDIKKSLANEEISEEEAKTKLKKLLDMSDEDIYAEMQTWSYGKKYGKLFDQIDKMIKTGDSNTKALQNVVEEYKANGYDESAIKSQITQQYKQKYLELSGTEKAAMKNVLISAYRILGKEADKAKKDIEAWEEKK